MQSHVPSRDHTQADIAKVWSPICPISWKKKNERRNMLFSSIQFDWIICVWYKYFCYINRMHLHACFRSMPAYSFFLLFWLCNLCVSICVSSGFIRQFWIRAPVGFIASMLYERKAHHQKILLPCHSNPTNVRMKNLLWSIRIN